MINQILKLLKLNINSVDYKTTKFLLIAMTGFLFFSGYVDIKFDNGKDLYNLFYLDNKISFFDDPTQTTRDNVTAFGKWFIWVLSIYFSLFNIFVLFRSLKTYGFEKYTKIYTAHFFSKALSLISVFIISLTIGLATYVIFSNFHIGFDSLFIVFKKYFTFLYRIMPTVHRLPPLLAIILARFTISFFVYLTHHLAHKSRILWLLFHRTHHTAEVLHPVGTGNFLFLDQIISSFFSIIATAIVSKLFYAEPIFFEITIVKILEVVLEKFNHASITYDFCVKNKVLMFIFSYFGYGPYHIIHHRSENLKNVNLGTGNFLVWDRLFGTYEKPQGTIPMLGLFNNPIILLNPIRMVFSGWAQVYYELKNNKNSKIRFKILFGSVDYVPPESYDYLIQQENEFVCERTSG